MEKRPLSKEQVEEIIDALEEEDFEDETELLGLTGEAKTTYLSVSCEEGWVK